MGKVHRPVEECNADVRVAQRLGPQRLQAPERHGVRVLGAHDMQRLSGEIGVSNGGSRASGRQHGGLPRTCQRLCQVSEKTGSGTVILEFPTPFSHSDRETGKK
jgi:hypothetical protein